MSVQEKDVLIAIPTTGTRPLEMLVRALSTLRTDVTIAIFHNGSAPARDTEDLASLFQGIRVVKLKEHGYASVRNAIIRYASRYRYLIYFDDDQLPSLGWYESMVTPLSAPGERRPHVVFGPVAAVSRGAGALCGEDYRPASNTTKAEGAYDGDVYSGNTLVDLDFVRAHAIEFDPVHDVHGGEDTDFFRKCRRHNVRVHYSRNALAIEFIDPPRRTVSSRYRAGVVAGIRARTIQPTGARSTLRKMLRLPHGILQCTTGVATLHRRRLASGLYSIGAFLGYFAHRPHQVHESRDTRRARLGP